MSVAAETVSTHEQRSALGLHRRQQISRSRENNRNPATKLLAEGLIALTEGLRQLDAKLGRLEQQVQSSTAQ
jgi:hypothetical protein